MHVPEMHPQTFQFNVPGVGPKHPRSEHLPPATLGGVPGTLAPGLCGALRPAARCARSGFSDTPRALVCFSPVVLPWERAAPTGTRSEPVCTDPTPAHLREAPRGGAAERRASGPHTSCNRLITKSWAPEKSGRPGAHGQGPAAGDSWLVDAGTPEVRRQKPV